MTLGKGLLPDPFPPTGPDRSTLAAWASDLDDADQQLTAVGNRLLQAAVDPQAWYGQAADNFREQAAALGYALIGLGAGMTAVASALLTYEVAGEQWDEDLAAGKRLDAAGVTHDREVETRYRQAYAAWRAAQIPSAPTGGGAAPGQAAPAPGSPSSSGPRSPASPSVPTNADGGPLTSTEVTGEVLPQVWTEVAAFAEQPDPPMELDDYDSPQKLRAARTVAEAEQTLVLAGLLAASRVDTVVGEMTTSVEGRHVTHGADPLTGLTALGVTELARGDDVIDPPSHQTAAELRLERENGISLPSLDTVLATNDVRGGALTLAERYWGDDGRAGAADSAAAGDAAASDLGTGRVPTQDGAAEGDDLTGDGDDLEVSRVGALGVDAVSVLGIAGDVSTYADTPDHGFHAGLTRTAAILNAYAAGTDATLTTAAAIFGSTAEIPGVDVVTGSVLLATGAYTLINHWVSGDPPPKHTELP